MFFLLSSPERSDGKAVDREQYGKENLLNNAKDSEWITAIGLPLIIFLT
jgi:hypothetical protein